MIRLEKIGKQNGRQIVFIEASAALQKGEKIGLVGPNGAGKTTLFRMITGEEEPDEGQVATDRGVTIGYFSQDVGEMSGCSVVSAVMDGAGPVSAVGLEMKVLEAAFSDPDRADEMDALIARYGEVQARFEELDGYALEGRAYEVLAGLSFSQEMMDGDVGKLSGGWKMRVELARILLMRPDAMLLDEPSNHLDLEIDHLARSSSSSSYEGGAAHDLARPRVHEPHRPGSIEIEGGEITTYSGDYEFYDAASARSPRASSRRVRAPAGDAGKKEISASSSASRRAPATRPRCRAASKKLEKIDKVEPPKRRQIVDVRVPRRRRAAGDRGRRDKLKVCTRSYGSRQTDLRRTSSRASAAANDGA